MAKRKESRRGSKEGYRHLNDSGEADNESSEEDLVIFNTKEVYTMGADLECCYVVTPNYEPKQGDWIGLYKMGWKSLKEHVAAIVAPLPPHYKPRKECHAKLYFPAFRLPKAEGTYQFCYVSKMVGSYWYSEVFRLEIPHRGKVPPLMEERGRKEQRCSDFSSDKCFRDSGAHDSYRPESSTPEHLYRAGKEMLINKLLHGIARADMAEEQCAQLRQKIDEMLVTMWNMSLVQNEMRLQLDANLKERQLLEQKLQLQTELGNRPTRQKTHFDTSSADEPYDKETGDKVQTREKVVKSFERRRMSVLASRAVAEDGDFVAIQAKRDTRTEEPLLEDVKEGEVTELPKRQSFLTDSNTPTIDAEAFAAWTKGEISKLCDLVEKNATAAEFREALKAVTNLDVKNPLNNQNILHVVLTAQRKDLAYLIIQRVDKAFLLQQCDVSVETLKGKKNALHFITELEDVGLATLVLSKFADETDRMTLLSQEVPVELEGQRPRTFPSLHLAAFLGCTKLVILYLENGVPVDYVNSKRDTALLWAARWGHLDVIKILLERKARCDIENDKGSTALYWAVRYEHTEAVRMLITQGGANVNQIRLMGLVHPLVLSSALGNLPICMILVDHGADVNYAIRGRERPLHHAAKEGHSIIVQYLLDKGADIDATDESGDTPLLYATRSGHPRCVQVLLMRGSNFDHKNHTGEDMISLAVECADSRVLKIALTYLKNHADTTGCRSPLLLAAANGECDKMHILLRMKLDPTATDDEGNNILHRAAMENQASVIKGFCKWVKIDAQNARGNTALHEACFRGNWECIIALIDNKASGSIRNNEGRTVLHVAACCKNVSPKIVTELMGYVVQSHAWEALSIKDNMGFNALHLAAKYARPQVMWEFRMIPFKIKDNEGNIALHCAVREGDPDALGMMLNIYHVMKHDADLNEQNNKLETVLHLAAGAGFVEHINSLILFGADMSIQDRYGNNVFHTVVQLCADFPSKTEIYLAVFEELMNKVALWWCMKNQLEFPYGDQKAYEYYTREAAYQLLTESYNNNKNNVIASACRVGAEQILTMIMGRPELLCFERGETMLYNVTYMTPLTMHTKGPCSCWGRKEVGHTDERSYIEWLVDNNKPELSSKVLDIQPFRYIEEAYSTVAAWTYIMMMILHIAYMSLFSYSGFILQTHMYGECPPNCHDFELSRVILYTILPLEPLLIMTYQLYSAISMWRYRRMEFIKILSKRKLVISNAMSACFTFLYSGLVVMWIIAYTVQYEMKNLFLSGGMLCGWLYSIKLTRGLRIINYFWRLIQKIVVKDITKFLTIYAFVLLAFAFNIHCILRTGKDGLREDLFLDQTIFRTFDLMLGMGVLFDEEVYGNIEPFFVYYLQFVYVLYRLLATILLLNLLIATMNDSYSSIVRLHGVDWRLDLVRLGCDIERSFPASTFTFSDIAFKRGGMQQSPKKPAEGPVKDGESVSASQSDPNALPEPLDRPGIWYIAVPLGSHTHRTEDKKKLPRTYEVVVDLKTRLVGLEEKLDRVLERTRACIEGVPHRDRDVPTPTRTGVGSPNAPAAKH